MDGGGQRFAARLTVSGPFGGLFEAAQHGAYLRLLEQRRRARQKPIENVDYRLGQRPDRLRFGERCHECGPAAFLFERRKNFRRAEAIGVGLYNRCRPGRRRKRAQLAVIAPDGSEPDQRNPGRLRRGICKRPGHPRGEGVIHGGYTGRSTPHPVLLPMGEGTLELPAARVLAFPLP